MSELKDYNIMEIEAMDDERLEKSESGKIQVTRVYIKSEADKVIAELKACEDVLVTDNRNLLDKVKKLENHLRENAEHFKRNEAQILENAENELRRHKHKRCLAMAKWCHDKWNMSLGWDPAEGYTADFFLHYEKWEKRWLELAEMFK